MGFYEDFTGTGATKWGLPTFKETFELRGSFFSGVLSLLLLNPIREICIARAKKVPRPRITLGAR
jgi:hypothetical protein